MSIENTCQNCRNEFDSCNMLHSGTGNICQWCATEEYQEDKVSDELWEQWNVGCADDVKVDFDFDVMGPATCSECGKEFPINELDPSDSVPLCPSCKYIDWCDICGSDCYCNEAPEDLDDVEICKGCHREVQDCECLSEDEHEPV